MADADRLRLGRQCGLKALCGGEALQPALLQRFFARTAALWNLYGPTETTIWSTCAQITRDREKPFRSAGRLPIRHVWSWMNRSGRSVAGTAGELLIGGPGLARGYHNDPDRTAQSFVCDPQNGSVNGKFFRTGDFVRLRPDGTLQFLGRRDQQVKIRGFRVELGEIETALHNHPMVREAAVVAIGDDLSDRRLEAFVVADESSEQKCGPSRPSARIVAPLHGAQHPNVRQHASLAERQS